MGALDGLLVIAIEQAVAAPICTVRLADAGARVIKIEREGGETARHYDAAVHGTSAYFAWLNRGKESAVLDLKNADDLSLLRKMLRKADVLVQNLAPGALARLGFAPEVIKQDFPRLIVVSIVGYGQDTPYADMRAYDLLVQAESGLATVTGTPSEPAKVGASVADIGTGMNAHAAILEALIERGKTGMGKQIEIAMFDSMVDWMSVPLLHYEHQGRITERHGMAHASIYPYGPFRCADGTILLAVQTRAEWERLCKVVLKMPLLVDHPDFATNPDRVANRKMLDSRVVPVFEDLTVDVAADRLKHASIAHANLTEIPDLGNHPALRRVCVTLSDGMEITLPLPAGRTHEFTPGALPDPGQHTHAIRKEFDNPGD